MQDKDTLARGLRIKRDHTKAITGSKQICEPVVKEALHTHVTRNPTNKLHTSTTEALSSAIAIRGYKTI